ncbi:MAG: phospho-N-acetylmuramoyl-pentapeptide-transferase [Proteobacteria bacterium]|nr:phospho-N-acetylmuramoyl-pentapeptide-transferase [Pseudomonadota bacterium]
MIYHLATNFTHQLPFLNVLKYITFRSGAAMFTALILSFMLGMPIIRWLQSWQNGGQPIREDGPDSHLVTKKGTPTMGGLLMLFSIIVSTLLWSDWRNSYMWVVLFVLCGYGALGFADDYLKVSKRNTKGVPGKIKLLVQLTIALIAAILISAFAKPLHSTALALPFFKYYLLQLGVFYFFFAALVITGSSNAVNLTDGLDGLAIGPIMIVAACFALICYLVGNVTFANYLQLHAVQNSSELCIFCCAIIGAGLGFLWYNAPPAQVFMGDVGSLSLGGAIGTVSVIVKHEIVLFVIGGLFVIETLSVIIQVTTFKLYGRRTFKMAPIHHHFEKIGWSETKIVMRFWIIAIIFALLGLSTLKLR